MPTEYVGERLAYCEAVKRKHQATLDKWAYTDGTVFFIDRTAEEAEHSKRRALGSMVWRQSDGSDALFADCVGPSAYSKAQGKPIRVWGVLANGKLHVEVLDEGDVMNKDGRAASVKFGSSFAVVVFGPVRVCVCVRSCLQNASTICA